jgi:hypothetical protein
VKPLAAKWLDSARAPEAKAHVILVITMQIKSAEMDLSIDFALGSHPFDTA